jgi:hypothetical protein
MHLFLVLAEEGSAKFPMMVKTTSSPSATPSLGLIARIKKNGAELSELDCYLVDTCG